MPYKYKKTEFKPRQSVSTDISSDAEHIPVSTAPGAVSLSAVQSGDERVSPVYGTGTTLPKRKREETFTRTGSSQGTATESAPGFPLEMGDVDGFNLFRRVRNNPVTLCDSDGRMPKQRNEYTGSPESDTKSQRISSSEPVAGPSGLRTEVFFPNIDIEFPQINNLDMLVGELFKMEQSQDAQTDELQEITGLDDIFEGSTYENATEDYYQRRQEYYQSDLYSLLSRDHLANNRLSYIKEHSVSTFSGSNTITTILNDSFFENSFYPDVLVAKKNYRNQNSSNFFASDVVRYQYEIISKKEGFWGYLPSRVIHHNTMNDNTLYIMNYVEENGMALLPNFLNKTPNGKSTQRILSLFGLEATGIKIDKKFSISYIIDTRLKDKTLWRPWE